VTGRARCVLAMLSNVQCTGIPRSGLAASVNHGWPQSSSAGVANRGSLRYGTASTSTPKGCTEWQHARQHSLDTCLMCFLASTGFVSLAAVPRRRSHWQRKRSAAAKVTLRGVLQFRVFKACNGEEFEIFDNEVLGCGEQGTVYGGCACATNEHVAIKVIPTWRLALDDAGQEKLEAIEKEFELVRRIGRHPNIAGMLGTADVFSNGAANASFPHYKLLVMERVVGQELAETVALQGALKESLARHIFLQILDGLEHMHDRHVVHRDLKPENVLVSGGEITLESKVKLIDFGVAKCIRAGPMSTVCGTPSVMAPEVAKAMISYVPKRDRPAFAWGGCDGANTGILHEGRPEQERLFCPKVDVWSLGVVLYICLTGKLPFQTQIEIIELDYSRTPLDHVSAEARELLAGMLEKEPEQRLSLADCLAHPWVGCSEGDACTIDYEQMLR